MRADDVALLLVSQAVGVGKRAERGTHSFQGLRGRSALCTSPAAIPAFEATSGEQSSTLRPPPEAGRRLFPLGRPSGEQGSIRSVVPGQETDPRFLRRETLEKPEIENECRRPATLDGRGFGHPTPKCSLLLNRNATTLQLRDRRGLFHQTPRVSTWRSTSARLRSTHRSSFPSPSPDLVAVVEAVPWVHRGRQRQLGAFPLSHRIRPGSH